MDIEALHVRAAAGTLSGEELRFLREHVHHREPYDVRIAAIGIAGAYLERAEDALLLFELIRISEDNSEDEQARSAAIRALAKATRYHGKPVQLDL